MNELYSTLSIFVTGGLFLACGLIFLFMAIPGNPLLDNYRKARYAMAFAYLFFFAVEIAKYLSRDLPVYHVPLLRTVTLTIAASQAFAFTFAMLALIDVRFPGWRSILREAIPALGLVAAVATVYACCSEACFNTAFYGFAAIYALLLARYTFLFRKNYRLFRYRMDNYFSGPETGRLRWVAFSFYAALSVGVMALLTSAFMSTLVALIFTFVFDIFYTFFAIRFINYPHRFRAIERAMDDGMPEEARQPEDENAHRTSAVSTLETNLKKWLDGKRFLQPGITIDDVALQIGTNRNYLSEHINSAKGKTFRRWINELRIEEARRLLQQYPEMTVSEIAFKSGFVNKSHFGQQFLALTGSSPSNWRKQNKN
ncbi:MAG: helix-turn-helix domain-containing protein [Tannerella sp.]|jgi:AraC-like DNA-binding protein|nr:helix-turn-helix domain-containing protein [Tannerella sp.]